MRTTAGVVVLLIAARGVDAVAGPTLADCASQLAADGGAVTEICPDVAAAIADGPFAGVALGEGRPTARDVLALQALVSAFADERVVRTVDPALLDRILATLDLEEEAPKSLWRRFNEWLADRWQDLVKWLDVPNPFAGFHWKWPEWGTEFLRSAGWGVFAMVSASVAIGTVLLLRGRKLRLTKVVSGLRRSTGDPSPVTSLSDLGTEPPARRLRLLLQLVLAELGARGLLTEHRALTHRELAGAAVGLEDPERHALRRVALGAEQATYSQREPAESEAVALVELGRSLLGQGAR